MSDLHRSVIQNGSMGLSHECKLYITNPNQTCVRAHLCSEGTEAVYMHTCVQEELNWCSYMQPCVQEELNWCSYMQPCVQEELNWCSYMQPCVQEELKLCTLPKAVYVHVD